MYSMLDELDKYIKENNIPFKAISFNKSYLPDYINMAILKEMQKISSLSYIKVNSEYQLRYDKNGNLYILVHSNNFRECFAISGNMKMTIEDFKLSGRSEKHIIKWGCLFKILKDDINGIVSEINSNFSYLNYIEKSKLKYDLIDELLENKYLEFVDKNKFISNEVDYEEDMIESTYKLKDYIRYLFDYYNDGIKIKKRVY